MISDIWHTTEYDLIQYISVYHIPDKNFKVNMLDHEFIIKTLKALNI